MLKTPPRQASFYDAEYICEELIPADSYYRKFKEVISSLIDETAFEDMSKSFFAYFDILGTKDLVMSGKFSDYHALDFVNPVGITAQRIPSVRFAAFSDCVMISAPINMYVDFIKAIASCYIQWCADFIFVRGGISLGEIDWVDHEFTDPTFSRLNNFVYARLYGKALVSAYKLESSSGPGVICFVDRLAAGYLSKYSNNLILKFGGTDTLIWCSKKQGQILSKCFKDLCQSSSIGSEEHRQFYATMNYFSVLLKNNKFLPKSFKIDR